MHPDTKKFLEAAGNAASRSVAFALERNMPLIIADIDRLTADGEDPELDVGIKVKVRHDSPSSASIKVQEVAWSRRYKYSDRDFMPAEVNLAQPELEFTFATRPQVKDEKPEPADDLVGIHGREPLPWEKASMLNLVHLADDLGCDIYRWCNWPEVPNADRSLLRYDHNARKWDYSLCQSVEEATKVMQVADEQNKSIVLDGAGMLMSGTRNRIKAYVDIVGAGNDSVIKYNDVICQPVIIMDTCRAKAEK